MAEYAESCTFSCCVIWARVQDVPHGGARSNPRKLRRDFIQHKMILKSFCKSQFPQKIVNLFFTLVMVKAKFTDLCGN
jgi:hypothetical protein